MFSCMRVRWNVPSMTLLWGVSGSSKRPEGNFGLAIRCFETMLMLVQQVEVRGKQIHDANIVATMLSGNVTHLFTHNVEDFDRYSAFITAIPLIEG